MKAIKLIAFIIILALAVISGLSAFNIIKINIFGGNQLLISVITLSISAAILERIARS